MGISNKTLTQYSFLNVSVMVNQRAVTGFWEGDDAVQIEPHSPTGTALVGADGAAIFSVSADSAVNITLRLQPNSPMHAYLNQLLLAMLDGNFDPFPISVRDTRNGEGGSSATATLMTNSTKQFGVNASVREWQIFAQGWEWNEQAYA